MIYLIQEGFYKERSEKKLLQALDITNSKYIKVRVSDDTIHCYLREGDDILYLGVTHLVD